MSVRALDSTGDWIYGIGRSAYLTARAEVQQSISTRLYSFVGNCFFDLGSGLNWFGFLGGKDQIGLNLAISTIILNTNNVTSINELNVSLNTARNFFVQYSVNTPFGVVTGIAVVAVGNTILTEDGFIIEAEDGSSLVTE